ISSAAGQRNAKFIDLFNYNLIEPHRLTHDGVHLTPLGFWMYAPVIESQLVYPPVDSTAKPESDQVEKLRKLIVAKNVDFFNYWRPENDTYILGYRKGEQGRNAP